MRAAARVADVLDQRFRLAEQFQQAMRDLQVGAFAVRADVVRFAERAVMQHVVNARTVIHHIDPVAHLLARAVERNLFVVDQAGDEERDQLFRVLEGAEVVAAARDERRACRR